MCEEIFYSIVNLIAHMKFGHHEILWKATLNKQMRNNDMRTIKEGRDWGGLGKS